MSTAADRKAELELKKEKLRALREEKLRREELKLRGLGCIDSAPASSTDLRGEANALLRNLGIDPLKSPEFGEIGSRLPRPVDNGTKSSVSIRPKKLQYCLVSEFDLKPHPLDSYTKETQTIDINPNRESGPMDYYVLTYDDSPVEHDSHLVMGIYDNEVEQPDAKMLKSVHGEVPRQTAPIMKEELKQPALVELSEEQKQQMLLSEGFRHFFDKSVRIVERALCDSDRPSHDYSIGSVKTELPEDLLPYVVDLYAERWSTNRTVVDLDWSPIYPELVLAAYSANEEATDEPAGCCMVWNLKFPTRGCPEYRFHCTEPITAVAMVRFHPNLVIGGTYSGQVVLWDSRSNKRTPVQRSTFTTMTHTQPINSVQVIGSQNAHNAITLSSDGTMCSWSLENLGAPRERIRVCETPNTPTGMFDLIPTCMDFFAGDQNNFVVGTEVGHIYTDQRHSSRTVPLASRSIRRPQPFSGHSTMVSGIATHPSPSAISFSHIFLSSSLDWTVRLWSVRDNTPLHTFDDYSECVYGVDWSPLHSALFAAVDGTGRIDVWNLIEDIEVPTARCRSQFTSAMNKVKWDTTGLFLAAGDDEGHVHICAVAEPLALPGPEDAARLAHVFAGLKATSSSANQTVSS